MKNSEHRDTEYGNLVLQKYARLLHATVRWMTITSFYETYFTLQTFAEQICQICSMWVLLMLCQTHHTAWLELVCRPLSWCKIIGTPVLVSVLVPLTIHMMCSSARRRSTRRKWDTGRSVPVFALSFLNSSPRLLFSCSSRLFYAALFSTRQALLSCVTLSQIDITGS